MVKSAGAGASTAVGSEDLDLGDALEAAAFLGREAIYLLPLAGRRDADVHPLSHPISMADRAGCKRGANSKAR